MKIFLLLLAVALLTVAGFAIFKSQKKEYIQGIRFQYYPKANVYYDLDNKEYHLLQNEKWQRSKNITEEQQSFLGKGVVINKPAIPVWKDNEQHRLIYGTALYTSTADVKQKYYEDSIRSLPKKIIVPKADSVAVEEEEKKRSGVRNFFDRIFKKKKD